jgi:hypothetical protein
MALFSEETTDDGNVMVALLEDVATRDEAGAPFVKIRSMLAAVGVDVLLRNAKDNRSNFGPYTGAGTHGTGLVCGIEDEVGEVTAIAAGYVFEGFQFHMLDARSRSFHAITGIGDDDFAFTDEAGDDGTDGIVSAIPGAFGLGDGKLHEFLSRLIGSGNHRARVYPFVAACLGIGKASGPRTTPLRIGQIAR